MIWWQHQQELQNSIQTKPEKEASIKVIADKDYNISSELSYSGILNPVGLAEARWAPMGPCSLQVPSTINKSLLDTNYFLETIFNVTIIVITPDNEQKGIEEFLNVKIDQDTTTPGS